ncbi:hypothetical protein RUM44_004793 [Polyplax serrata]|uniref:Uncharacterized protein n=1 Tax=Polyplax serrata TaxID=468196 RepID=A0ABR1B3W4_POLSC
MGTQRMAVRTLPQPLFLSTLPCYHVNQIWGTCRQNIKRPNAKYPVPVVVAQPTSNRELLERQTRLAESERKWAGGTSQVEDDADDNGKNKCSSHTEMNGRREKVRWT